MEKLLKSYDDAPTDYPACLVFHREHEHVLQNLLDKLNERAQETFCQPENEHFDVIQYDFEAEGHTTYSIKVRTYLIAS